MVKPSAAAAGGSNRRPALSIAWPGGAAVALLVVLALAVFVVVEGDLDDRLADLRRLIGGLIRHYGAAGGLGLLYLEESGIPLPMPGDVFVTYLGHLSAGSMLKLVGAWVGVVAVVTAGASNLYWVARRWGPRFASHPLAGPLHLDPERLERARRWFDHRGVLAMIVGRHIPGFRVPLTVVAGTLRFPYRLFAPSVAVSTAIWGGVFLILGERYGRSIAHFLAGHSWAYGAGTLLIVVYLALSVVRSLLGTRVR